MAIHYDKLALELLPYGIPIYAGSANNNPMMVGSSVLAKLNGIYFLITAAHVINQFIDRDPCIIAPAQGRFLRISELRSKLSKDPLDLFIAELEGAHLDETRTWRNFIDLSSLNRNPMPSDISVGSTIGFVGYPYRKNPIRKPVAQSPTIPALKGHLITCEHAEPGRPSYCHRDPHIHIVADFSRRKYQRADGTHVHAPDPHGMSGGGAWLLCGDDRGEMTVSHHHLLGITIEYEKNKHSLVATRLEHLFSALKTFWPNAILA